VTIKNRIAIAAAGILLATSAFAVPVQYSVSTTVSFVDGSFAGDVLVGHTITGTFIVDNDTANAGPGSDPTPSNNPGHEYSSFWEFDGAPYGGSVTDVELGATFNSVASPAIVVNNNLDITSDETGGMVPDGTYDWIEVLISDTTSICLEPGGICDPGEYSPADGQEWTLAIFADTSWIGADDEIPGALPGSYTAFIIGIEFDVSGNEIGTVIAPASSLSLAVIPIPAAVWLFASGLGLLGWLRRR